MNIRILMRDIIVGGPYIIHLCGVVTARTQSRQSLIEGRPTYTGDIVGGRSALASTIVAFCHGTEAKQAVVAGQLTAVVVCSHSERAVEQRPRIAAARDVSDTVSHWRTMTARSHMPAGPGCQRGLVFYGPIQGEKAMTTVIRGIVGGPYHPPLWRCHSTEAKQVAMTGQ